MSKKPTAVELIKTAAADPNLTPESALINLSRLALHLGTTDGPSLKQVGPALGHMAQGLGKVVAAKAGQGGGDDGELLKRFLDPEGK